MSEVLLLPSFRAVSEGGAQGGWHPKFACRMVTDHRNTYSPVPDGLASAGRSSRCHPRAQSTGVGPGWDLGPVSAVGGREHRGSAELLGQDKCKYRTISLRGSKDVMKPNQLITLQGSGRIADECVFK